MFCLKNVPNKVLCRLSRSCLDWSYSVSITSAKLSKSKNLEKRLEKDNHDKPDNMIKAPDIPLALQYLMEEDEGSLNSSELFKKSKADFEETLEDIKFDIENLKSRKRQLESESKKKKPANELIPLSMLVGTPDPLHRPSDVPCGGCGSFLHCNDPSIPGYVPQQMFKGKTKSMLSELLCRRCKLLQSGTVIKLDIDRKEYANVVKQIKKEMALIIMVVDVTDMANSVIPEFLASVGSQRRPIFVVGNKIDLYPKDDKSYLNRILERLKMECEIASLNPSGNNIKYTSLVSAKTGYGIEELINRLIGWWGVKGTCFCYFSFLFVGCMYTHTCNYHKN